MWPTLNMVVRRSRSVIFSAAVFSSATVAYSFVLYCLNTDCEIYSRQSRLAALSKLYSMFDVTRLSSPSSSCSTEKSSSHS